MRAVPLLFLLSVATAYGDDVVIIDAGKSRHSIIVAADASPAAQTGAKELQRIIRCATGVELPLLAEAKGSGPAIYVGEVGDGSLNGCPPDSYRISSHGNDVCLNGVDDRAGEVYSLGLRRSPSIGSLQAVHAFCEKFLGVRWYMPGRLGEEIPQRQTLALPQGIDIRSSPRFPVRRFDVTMNGSRDRVDRLVRRGRLRGSWFDPEANLEAVRWGRRLGLGMNVDVQFGHAWREYVPADKATSFAAEPYGKSHPEFFALVNGRRMNFYRNGTHGGQLCLSNPLVVETVADNIIRHAIRSGNRFYSLSANDGGDQCQCPGCESMGHGSLTDRILLFSNQIAERVTTRIPDARFGLYAYHETRSPPVGIRAHPSIIVSDVYNGLPFLALSPAAARAMEHDQLGWRTSVTGVVLTSYYLGEGFWSLPWSTTSVLIPLIQRLDASPASMGAALNWCHAGDQPALGMNGPDLWVAAKLLWDPSLDPQTLLDDYYAGCFTPAVGVLVRTYFDTIHSAMTAAVTAAPLPGRDCPLSAMRRYVAATYAPIRARCAALMADIDSASRELPERYRWRLGRIIAGWRLAELTVDGMDAGSAARRLKAPAGSAAVDNALALAEARLSLLASPDSRFALAPHSVDYMDRAVPLGILTKEDIARPAPSIKVPWCVEPLVIDGILDESPWRQAATSGSFVDNATGKAAAVSTTMRVLWCAQGLGIAFSCAEPAITDMRSAAAAEQIWNGEVVEIFLSPGRGFDEYTHWSVAPNGLRRALALRGDRGYDAAWNPRWQAVARTEADRWIVEILLPWSALGLDQAPTPGDSWTAGFFRERHVGQILGLSAWSPTHGPFNDIGRHGSLLFTR